MESYKPYGGNPSTPIHSLLDALSKAEALTENLAPTFATSNNLQLDFFFQIGSMRNQTDEQILDIFWKSFTSNPKDTLKILFYGRDPRGGQGERRIFKIILKSIACSEDPNGIIEQNMRKLIPYIPIYGRWDDLFSLFDTPYEEYALNVIKDVYKLCVYNKKDTGIYISTHPLMGAEGGAIIHNMAKWLPREKSSNKAYAIKIRKYLGMSPKEYRKFLSKYTDVVENLMCSKQWNDIIYDAIPSKAMNTYKKAFAKHSPDNWSTYLTHLEEGKANVNASTLFPHEIIKQLFFSHELIQLNHDEQRMLDQQWNALPNYMENNPLKILPVVDVSGSMYNGTSLAPIVPAISLGLYIAEKNKGIFHNAFISFSEKPELILIPEGTLYDKLSYMKDSSWGYNTNFANVFKLVLDNAVLHKISQEEMPNCILVLSDMEFDQAFDSVDQTNYEFVKDMYSKTDYEMPKMIFWNLNARQGNVPVKSDESDTALISGFSPIVLKYILKEGLFTPEDIMNFVISSNRYNSLEEIISF